jgi:hypothetical protein
MKPEAAAGFAADKYLTKGALQALAQPAPPAALEAPFGSQNKKHQWTPLRVGASCST